MGALRWRLAAAAATLAAIGIPAATAVARSEAAGVTTVRVTLLDFRVVVSRPHVPPGTVRFVVVNRGAAPHDFKIGGKKTRVLPRGGGQTITVRFAKPGRLGFLCTVPGHARIGMKGVLVVGNPPKPRTKPPEPPAAPPVPSSQVKLTEIGRFEEPVLATAPPGDERRLAIIERGGRVWLFVDGTLQTGPFLDLRGEVKADGEEGLLSLAFAPNYAASGRFYVFFNDRAGHVNVREYVAEADRVDPARRRTVLFVEKPWSSHNGGMLQFAPNGRLWISLGDGDGGTLNRPGAFAQTLDDLLGTLLRIDPLAAEPYAVPADNPLLGTPGARPEIWAYGLRNPWRFWIDPATGDLYVGDVAAGGNEEIDYVAARSPGGLNFGWPCYEGTRPYDETEVCPDAVPPVLEYDHTASRCSVTAGVVVRDPRLPALEGRFLYGDFCNGEIRSLRIEAGKAVDDAPLGVTVQQLSSFGVDAGGRAYAISLAGPVYRLDPGSATPTRSSRAASS